MYNPAPFVEDRIDVLHELIRQYPLATIVTCGPSGPEATHVPVVLHADQGANGVLRCHLARANDHGKSFLKGSAVLAIFHGADHYITPSWYTTKQEHGKVVPTWNYYQLGTPDGTLSLAGLAINVPIAGFGGADRAQKTPYVPIAAATKSAIEAVAAGWYFYQMPAKEKKWCAYCIAGALANFGIFALAVPEALKAIAALREK